MTDLPTAPAAPPVVPSDPRPSIDPHAVVQSVVQSVQENQDVHPSKAAGLIATILAGLYEAQPAVFAVTRASPQTQAEVALGLGLARIIVGAFLKPAS